MIGTAGRRERRVTGWRRALVVAAAAGLAVAACGGPSTAPPAPPTGAAGDFAQGVDIGSRSVYVECHGANAPGRHTVVGKAPPIGGPSPVPTSCPSLLTRCTNTV